MTFKNFINNSINKNININVADTKSTIKQTDNSTNLALNFYNELSQFIQLNILNIKNNQSNFNFKKVIDNTLVLLFSTESFNNHEHYDSESVPVDLFEHFSNFIPNVHFLELKEFLEKEGVKSISLHPVQQKEDYTDLKKWNNVYAII